MAALFRQPSVMSAQQHFSNVPSADVPRSTFDRSHAYKTAFDAGLLIPVFVDEVLPGDTFKVNATAFARLATPRVPFMDNVFMDIHYFFVPNRLGWVHWVNFMGERVDPDDDPNDYDIPRARVRVSDAQGTIADFFGLPAGSVGNDVYVNALPFRAYELIWNAWYRSENLQDSLLVPTGDDDDTDRYASYFPLRRNKRADYFTRCLPWPQKGDAVMLPLGTVAPLLGASPISGIGGTTGYTATGGVDIQQAATPQNPTGDGIVSGLAQFGILTEGTGTNARPDVWAELGDSRSTAFADLADATAISVNDLRLAIAMQQMLERDARGGTRYIEAVFEQFGVVSPDARLQRPEFLGGGTTRVNINPIASTAQTSELPQGNLAAIGTSLMRGGFVKSFTEHGFVIGIASVRADLTYQRGLDRMWTRRTRADHYTPVFAHLGEQAVLQKEIFYKGTVDDDLVFGYQERWAEYRFKLSKCTNLMSSYATGTLDYWHLAQDFGDSAPVLNGSFLAENPPIDRVISVPSEPHFICDIWFNFINTRPMPIYSVPYLSSNL